MHRSVALVTLLLLSTGCYRYVAQRPGSIPPGSDVRVHLSSEGVQRLGEAYGTASGTLEGRLESWAEDVKVTVPVQPAPGMLDRGLRNQIIIRQADIVGVDLRQRDRGRTIALSAGLGGVAAVTAVALFGGVFGGSQNEEEPLPEDVRIPFQD